MIALDVVEAGGIDVDGENIDVLAEKAPDDGFADPAPRSRHDPTPPFGWRAHRAAILPPASRAGPTAHRPGVRKTDHAHRERRWAATGFAELY